MRWRETIEVTGYAIVPSVFPADRVERLLFELDQLASKRSRAGIRHALQFAPVSSLARGPSLTEIARDILGSGAFPFRATLFDKSPGANWLVAWHQDTALPFQQRQEIPGWGPWSVKEGIHYAHAPASVLSQVLALRVHIDDSSRENGPLRILPRTHNLGVLNDNQICEFAKNAAPVDCVVPKGGVVAMSPLLLHASSKSRSTMPRRVLHIEYAASESIAFPLQLAAS